MSMGSFRARTIHPDIIEARTHLKEACRSVEQSVARMREYIDGIDNDHVYYAPGKMPPKFRSLLERYREGGEVLLNAVGHARAILDETAGDSVPDDDDEGVSS